MAFPKDANDHIPYMTDQGMPNMVATPGVGVALQVLETTVVAGALLFSDAGLSDMADALYTVYAQNDTVQTRTATIGSKTTQGFTTTGPSASDIQSYLIVGRLKGQVGVAGS